MSDLQVRLRAFRALVAVRFIEFFREPEAVFWTFVFPVILSVAVGVASNRLATCIDALSLPGST